MPFISTALFIGISEIDFYFNDEETRINPTTRVVVRFIYRVYLQGLGVCELQAPSRRTTI